MANEFTTIGTLLATIAGTVTAPQFLARYMVNYRALGANRRIRLISDLTVTTPALGVLPTVTITLNYGSSSLSVTAVGLLALGLTDRPIQIVATITATESTTAQWATITVETQNAAGVVTSRVLASGPFTTDTMASNEASLSITYSSILSTVVITPRTRVSEIVG